MPAAAAGCLLDHLFDGVALVGDGGRKRMARRFALHIDTAAAAINGDYRMRIDTLDGVGYRCFAMAAGHALYVECVLHGCSPLLIAVF